MEERAKFFGQICVLGSVICGLLVGYLWAGMLITCEGNAKFSQKNSTEANIRNMHFDCSCFDHIRGETVHEDVFNEKCSTM